MQHDTDRILRRPEVEALTGLARSTLYLHIKQGRFPSPVQIGPRAVGWRHSAVAAWLAERPASSLIACAKNANDKAA
ncbi:MAG: AlpA family transcriptional regulator [Pseudomonadota bacterium]